MSSLGSEPKGSQLLAIGCHALIAMLTYIGCIHGAKLKHD